MPSLLLRGLCLVRQGRTLIDRVDLDLESVGLTVIMGPNGAGKSLLLRLMHGLLKPDAGSVSWDGLTPDAVVRSKQGMLFQRPVLLRRSVMANMRFAAKRPGATVSDSACASMLDRVGLADAASKPARQLSGGEQQRVALARALIREPEVLFMDEPAASLDPPSTQAIETVVRELSGSHTKIIFVTHDVGQARRLADDVLFMHRGRILEQAPAAQFFDAPRCVESRQYLAGEIVF